MTCPRSLLPLLALAISFGIAAYALAPSHGDTEHATLASAFPIAQAQFAH